MADSSIVLHLPCRLSHLRGLSAAVLAVLASCVLVACSSTGSDATSSTTTVAPVTLTTLAPPTTSTSTTTLPPTTTAAIPPTVETDIRAGDVVDRYVIAISGTTDPGTTLEVDGTAVDVAGDGSFTTPERLNTIGSNTVVIRATSEAGASVTKRISYTFAPRDGWIAAIGDSVMLGSAPEIEKRLGPGIVDATVSRQFLAAPELVASLLARSDPPEVIVIGLGTNGPVQARHFDEVMELAADVPLVVFVNVRVPRTWEATSNSELAEGVARYDNAVLVDWYAATGPRDDLFAADGVHPKQPGRVIMAELIAQAIFPDWVPLEE